MKNPCYAPVFEGSSGLECFLRAIRWAFLLVALILLLVITFGSPGILCLIRQTAFRIQHCRQGNADPTINLNADAYEQHVRDYRTRYGKTVEWQQWMLDNRSRYENTFNLARARPATLNTAFRYDSDPIAYNPPWDSEEQHMAALESLAEGCYAGYDFRFIFNGDTAASYANVVAGIPTNSSHASGNIVYLYYETIFNHEFGHVMGVPHHYDTIDQVGDGLHMPPGDTRCLMDRNCSQYCSACRTALHIQLDVDNEAAISAASDEIHHRYPY